MSDHTNKTYLVTGGTTGIGAATVAALAEAGATVIATGRNPKTGVRVDVPPKRIPYFKPSKELKVFNGNFEEISTKFERPPVSTC